jgi:hypothetical protein
MASKRNVRKKSCTSKRCHKTAANAFGALRSLENKVGPTGQHVYRCSFGDHYHFGHIKPSELLNKRSLTS